VKKIKNTGTLVQLSGRRRCSGLSRDKPNRENKVAGKLVY